MVWCQVIKANNKPCANYARKGLTCCHAHRKLESLCDTDTEKVKVNPCNPKYVPTKPVKLADGPLMLNPWYDDGSIWEQVIDSAYEGPDKFANVLDFIAVNEYRTNGKFKCIFHKSLDEQHKVQIESIQGRLFFTRRLPDGRLEVRRF
jgi:hypothetical protein